MRPRRRRDSARGLRRDGTGELVEREVFLALLGLLGRMQLGQRFGWVNRGCEAEDGAERMVAIPRGGGAVARYREVGHRVR